MKFCVAVVLLIAAASQVRGDERVSLSGYVDETDRNPVATLVSNILGNLNFTAVGIIMKEKYSVCWKSSETRGVGKPVNTCADERYPEKDAGLCYKPCRDGYKGVGPVCWETCKPGYTDNGAFCGKSGKIISSNNKACPWYDICGLTFSKGCSFCPENNPKYKNDGCTCRIDPHTYAKDSYGRGVGKPMGCGSDKEYDTGLCYPLCKEGWEGIGPVCWKECPALRPHDFGAMCCKEKDSCKDFIKKVSVASTQAIAAAVEAGKVQSAEAAKDFISQAIKTGAGFLLFSCDRYD